MDSIDLERTARRARLWYEWGRFRRAILGFAPSIVLIVLAAAVTPRPQSALLFGTALFTIGVALLWYGQDLHRAVLPGVAAGMVPLAVTLCANQLGHVCTGGACMSLCLPACGLGGVLAGIVVAAVGHRGKRGWRYWTASSAVALLTGAMGCACIGYTGLIGLAGGYGIGMLFGATRASST